MEVPTVSWRPAEDGKFVQVFQTPLGDHSVDRWQRMAPSHMTCIKWLVAFSCSFPPSPAIAVPSWQYFSLLQLMQLSHNPSSIFWTASFQVAFSLKSRLVKSASAQYRRSFCLPTSPQILEVSTRLPQGFKVFPKLQAVQCDHDCTTSAVMKSRGGR